MTSEEVPAGYGTLRSRLQRDLPLSLLCIMAFTVPLYRSPYLEDSFLLPKTMLMLVFLTAISIILLFFRKSACESLHRCSVTSIGFVLFVAVNLAAPFYASSRPLAIQGASYMLSFALCWWISRRVLTDRVAVMAVLWAGFASAVCTSIWVLLEDAGRFLGFSMLIPRLPDWRGFLAAGVGNSGHIAGFIGLLLPFGVIQFLRSSRTNFLLLLALLVCFAALVVTWSIGSTGSAVLSLVIWAVVVARSSARPLLKWKRLSVVLGTGVVATAFYLIPHPLNPHNPSLLEEAFGSERWKEGGPTRLVIWETTWHMIKQHPIIGVGSGNFTREYVKQIVPSVVNDPALSKYAGGYTNDAHNEYLHIWSESGILGLLFYGIIIVGAGVCFRIRWRTAMDEEKLFLAAAGAGITVFLLDSLMTFPIRLPAHFAQLMIFLAIPHAVSPGREQGRHILAGRFAAVAAAVVLSGLSLMTYQRVMAAYYLKEARRVVESLPVAIPGQLSNQWDVTNFVFTKAVEEIVRGGDASPILERVRREANSESMRQAEVLFRASLSRDPYYSNTSSRLGALLLMQGRHGEARAILLRTLVTLEAYEIHERLGWTFYFQGDMAGAARHWTICRERRPVMAEYYTSLLRIAQRG